MTDSKGYYAILGVSEKANYHEIKKSYRRLARKYHPDRNRTGYNEDMIKKINAAFEVLSDETKKREYDRMGYNPEPEVEQEAEPAPAAESLEAQFSEPRQRQTTTRAPRKVDENLSGVYNLDMPKGRFHVIVEPSTCLAFGSCEILAPKVFVVEKNKRINPKARVENEAGADFQTILAAAQTCPTKAIRIVDRYTGEQVFP